MGACTSNKKTINTNTDNKNNTSQPQQTAQPNNDKKEEIPKEKEIKVTNNSNENKDKPKEVNPPQQPKVLVEQKSYFQKHLEGRMKTQKAQVIQPVHVFNPNQSIVQSQTTNYFNTSYNTNGEVITISFGNSFDIFNSFFESLYKDHCLDTNPTYNYYNFFSETEGYGVFTPRGFAFEIPNEQSEIFAKSIIGNSYHQFNVNFSQQTEEEREIFINSYLNDSKSKQVSELLRKEAEKCHNIHEIQFISDIFNGSAMGLLSSFFYAIQNDYRKVLKVAHLKYYDTFTHKAFSKRKNYIFSVANLYKECALINLLNASRGGDVINNLSIGERIGEYSSTFNINTIISSLLTDTRANFVYSNGVEIDKEMVDRTCAFVFFDCKEGRNHLAYYPQYSSLCIYKGNNYITDSQRLYFDKEISKLVNRKLNTNKGYYSYFEVNKPFPYDFVTNIHQSNLFKEMTEEYLLDFLQGYNLHNFSPEEKEMREDTIYKVNEVVNYYKEMWKLVK